MSSLLETFAILFESDAQEVRDGARDAEQATENLEDKINQADDSTQQLGHSFLNLTRSASRALLAVLGASGLIANSALVAQQTDELGKFSEALGLNVELVSVWSEAVKRSGGSAEGFRSTLGGLTDQLTSFALTGGGESAEIFARLGINAFDAGGKIKSAFDVLPEIADAFEQLTEAEAMGFGRKLGLDQATILLLQQGRREIDELIRKQTELGTITREDAKSAADFNNAWDDTRTIFNRLFVAANHFVLPALTSIFEGINAGIMFLKNNEGLVTGFFIGVAGVVTRFYLPAMLRAAAVTFAAVAPFALIVGAVLALGGALALIVNDFIAFKSGGDSVIGMMLDRFPAIGKIVDNIGERFSILKSFVMEVFDAILRFPDDLEGSAKRIGVALLKLGSDMSDNFLRLFEILLPDAAKRAVNKIKGFFTDLKDDIADVFDVMMIAITEIVKEIGASILDYVPGLSSLINGIGDFFNGQQNQVQGPSREMLEMGQTAISAAQNNPLASQSSSSISNSTNNVNRNTSVTVGKVDIDARNGNSAEIGRNIGSALEEQIRFAVSNFDDGVIA